MTYVFSFEKLIVWQKAKDLVVWSYSVTKVLPDSEKFGLVSQINRAVVSVSANIAEGNSRETNKDKIRFLNIAYGSLMETLNHYYILKELQYINEETFTEFKLKLSKYRNF